MMGGVHETSETEPYVSKGSLTDVSSLLVLQQVGDPFSTHHFLFHHVPSIFLLTFPSPSYHRCLPLGADNHRQELTVPESDE